MLRLPRDLPLLQKTANIQPKIKNSKNIDPNQPQQPMIDTQKKVTIAHVDKINTNQRAILGYPSLFTKKIE